MKQFKLAEAQALVQEAVDRSKPRHAFWSSLEHLFKTGSTGALRGEHLTGTLWDTLGSEELEQVNLVLPRVRLQVSRLTARDPRPIAQSQNGGPDADQQEAVVEALLEYFWNRTRGTAIVRDLAQDVVVLGNAFAKVGWAFEEEDVALDDDELFAQSATAIELERRVALAEGREMRPLADIEAELPTETTRTVVDEPYIAYVRPYDVFMPASARRLEESRWVAQRIIIPIDEAKERYPGHDFVAAELTADLQMSDEQRQSDEQLVELFEFWDLGTRNLKVFTLTGDKACFDDDWPHAHRYCPIVHLANHRARPSDLWGFGDLGLIASLQDRFNESWSQIIDSSFRAGRKYLAARGALSEDAVAALESPVDDLVVFLDGAAGQPLNELVSPLWRSPISGEVINASQQSVDLMDQVLAFNDFDTGGVGADRMSATAAAAVMGVTEERAMDRQLLLETAVSQLYMQMLLLTQEFLTTETVVRIVGPQGKEWRQVAQVDLLGEYRLNVETGSMQGETRAARKAEGQTILQNIVPALSQLGYNTDGLVHAALKKLGFDVAALNISKEPPPEMAAPVQQAAPANPSNGDAIAMLTDAGAVPAAAQDQAGPLV